MQTPTVTTETPTTPEPTVPDVLQVTEAPETPHEVADVTPESVQAPPEEETPELTPEQQELAALEAEADAAITPPGTTPTTPATPGQQPAQQPAQGGQGEPTAEDTANWAANILWHLVQSGQVQVPGLTPNQPNQPAQQPGQTQTEQPTDTGAADVYNGAFDDQGNQQPEPARDPRLDRLDEFLDKTVPELQGAVTNLQQQQADQQKRQAEAEAAQRKAAQSASIQQEYGLSELDATRVMTFFEMGEYDKGMKYARGKSQVEQATEAMVQERAADRNQAGRPAVPGGTSAAPTANEKVLDQKFKEYIAMPSDTAEQRKAKDEVGMWLIENGGMDMVRQDAMQVPQGSPTAPPPNQGVL